MSDHDDGSDSGDWLGTLTNVASILGTVSSAVDRQRQLQQHQKDKEREEQLALMAAIFRKIIFWAKKRSEAIASNNSISPEDGYFCASVICSQLELMEITPDIFLDFSDKEYTHNAIDQCRACQLMFRNQINSDSSQEIDRLVKSLSTDDTNVRDAIESSKKKLNAQYSASIKPDLSKITDFRQDMSSDLSVNSVQDWISIIDQIESATLAQEMHIMNTATSAPLPAADQLSKAMNSQKAKIDQAILMGLVAAGLFGLGVLLAISTANNPRSPENLGACSMAAILIGLVLAGGAFALSSQSPLDPALTAWIEKNGESFEAVRRLKKSIDQARITLNELESLYKKNHESKVAAKRLSSVEKHLEISDILKIIHEIKMLNPQESTQIKVENSQKSTAVAPSPTAYEWGNPATHLALLICTAGFGNLIYAIISKAQFDQTKKK